MEVQCKDIAGVEQEETLQAENDHKVNGESPEKKKKDTKSTSLEEAVTELTDSAEAQKMPSNEGNFEVLNSLNKSQRKRKWVQVQCINAELANVVNAMVKESIWDCITSAVRSQDVRLQKLQTSIVKGM